MDNSDLKMSDYMDLVASATGLEKPDRASFAKLNQLAAKGFNFKYGNELSAGLAQGQK